MKIEFSFNLIGVNRKRSLVRLYAKDLNSFDEHLKKVIKRGNYSSLFFALDTFSRKEKQSNLTVIGHCDIS